MVCARMTSRHLFAWLFVLASTALMLMACSSSSDAGGGSGDGGYACTQAPNCGECQACFDSCLCNGGDAPSCLLQCTGTGSGGTSGTGGAPGGGGATAGGGAPSGGGGGGGGSCTQLTTGNPTCDACAHSTCCAQIDACLTNSACTGFLSCISQNCQNAGSNLNACAQQYCSQYSAGINAYNTLAQCIGQSCAGSC